MQQGDNITFLLRKQLVMGADVAEIRGDTNGLRTDVAEIKGDINGLKTGQAEIRGDINGIKTGQAETNGKLDQLLQLLQKPSR